MQALVWLGPLVAAAGTIAFFVALIRVRLMAAADKRWAAASGQPFFSEYGEAIVGRRHLRKPFAHLTATPSALRLAARGNDYEFPRGTMKIGPGSAWWVGLDIQHGNPAYPSPVLFVSLDIENVRNELEKLGYVCER